MVSLILMFFLHTKTAATLTFAIYMLSQHPNILAQLREEIITKVGASGRPTHDDTVTPKTVPMFGSFVVHI